MSKYVCVDGCVTFLNPGGWTFKYAIVYDYKIF